MAQIGLRDFYYAKMTSDSSDTTVYETPVRIAGLVNIEINPSVQKNTLYGDDSPMAVANSLSEITVRIELADLPLQDEAVLLGHEYSSDTMKAKASDTAPYVAIIFSSERHDGLIRYVKLLKGMFSPSTETYATRGNSVEFGTPKIEGSFVTRESDGQWILKRDSDATLAETWFASVNL